MKVTALRTICFAALLIPVASGMKEPDAASSEVRQEHSSGLTTRITLRDGTIRMAKLAGLGCSKSICSRVAIKGKADGNSMVSLWLDRIAAIKDTTGNNVLLVMKNGTEQRMSLVTDFRVLYLTDRSRSSEKLDLAEIKSLEFLPSTK
jgi:hypothetical protein